MNRPAIFMDKDGTLTKDMPPNIDPDAIELSAGSRAGVQLLSKLGFQIVIVSNQAGVALGTFPETALTLVERRLRELLAELSVPLAGFYYCPHHPEGRVSDFSYPCDCRKPASGLYRRAARELGIDLSRSWAIGDILHDVEAGKRVGCKGILIDNGNETEWQLTSHYRIPDYTAACIDDAAEIVAKRVAAMERQA